MSEKGKEKKVEMREIIRNWLAQVIMQEKGMDKIERTKEGLVIREVQGEESVDIVVRVIQKKALVEEGDVVEVIVREDLVEAEEDRIVNTD